MPVTIDAGGTMPSPRYALTIPSDVRLVSLARAFVEGVCQACRLEGSVRHAVVLAAGEAVSNIIRHAHRDCPGETLQIQCWPAADSLEIHFLDEGEPFDLEAVPSLDPAELRVGGRGVFLMRTLMDEVSCQPRGRRGNLLRMVKRWTPPVPVRECG